MSEDAAQRLAVALQYDFEGAPRVIAKGRGEIAAKIMETAAAHQVAVEENPLLAEALARVELDEAIPVALYKAVAEVLGFVLRARERA